ncbi:MAG: MMPL family transporter [Dehalococcoidia bacterium]|nr:MMPL family transporter [Dehalococcoidia bacterium]
MNRAFAFLSRIATRHPWKVVAAWALVMIASAPFAMQFEETLSGAGWDVAGSDSQHARQLIERELPQTFPQNLVAVYHSDDPGIDDPRFADAVNASLSRVEADPEVAGIVSYFNTGNRRLVSEDGKTTYAVVGLNAGEDEAANIAPDLIDALRRDTPDGMQVDVTGKAAMWADFNRVNKESMLKGELMAWPAVMIVLILAFGSVVAMGLPLLLAMLGLATTFGLLYWLGHVVPLSIWVMNFAMMVGIGVGVDYALFIVTRFRQELQRGATVPDAVTGAVETSGKAIFFSGVIVILALTAVLLAPVVVFQSMALGMIVVVAVVLAASLTLLPALLTLIGPRIDRWRVPMPERFRIDTGASGESGFWHRWATAVMARPGLFALLSTAVLLALALPALNMKVAMPGMGVLPEDTTARRGFETLEREFGPGSVAPINVVIQRASGTAFEQDFLVDLTALSDRIAGDPEVSQVESIVDVRPDLTVDDYVALYDGTASQADEDVVAMRNALVNTDGGSDVTLVRVYPKHSAETDEAKGLVKRIRGDYVVALDNPASAVALVGGVPAENQDMTGALVGRVPLAILGVLVITYVFLVLVLRSLLLPAKAIVLNLLSVFANYGILVVIFQYGFGENILAFDSQGFVNAWSPLLWFALLFGLSMDYEMFLLSAVKERYEETGDNEGSVAWALERTARPISSAAIAIVAVFGSFALAGTLPPKEMGTGMAIAIALDATLIRLVLVPAAMRLMGRANWWLPRSLDRLLPLVSFGHEGSPQPALASEE